MASKDLKNDLMKMDLYKLLEVPEDADAKQIKKAYRTKALKCHPDKNPDNPNAANLFHQLSEALKVLTDIGARAAYDHVRKAKKLAQERLDKLDSKRKKVKLDLEAREKAAEADDREKRYAKATMKQEIERLRDEGSRILEEEQRKLREELKKEQELAAQRLNDTSEPTRLKVKWKASKGDSTNGGYNEKLLRKMFSKYGVINILLVSAKKRGSAVVEFKRWKDAELASIAELGLPSNPLKIDLIGEKPEQTAPPSDLNGSYRVPTEGNQNQDVKPCFPWATSHTTTSVPSSTTTSVSSKSSDDDFESQVLARLKKAQERKRQMQKEAAQSQQGGT